MTTTILLYTSHTKKEVIIAARAVGFTNKLYRLVQDYGHENVDDLVLGIHFLEGVVEMQFDDQSERFPNNPEAIEVLRELYEQLPDLKYGEILPWTKESKSLVELSPIKPLSEYLDSLE